MYAWLDTLCQVNHGPDARFLSGLTFEALVRANFPGEDTEPAAELLCEIIFRHGPGELNALYVLDHIRRSGGLKGILSVIEDGGHDQKLRNGIHGLRSSLASQLPKDAIHLSSPVIKIMQKMSCLTETSSGEIWSSKQVIMAIPTTEYNTVTFEPPPSRKSFGRSDIHSWLDLTFTYDTPWWKESGLGGAGEADIGGDIYFPDVPDSDILQANMYPIHFWIRLNYTDSQDWLGKSAQEMEAE
ncbi:hypothetical protein QBC37DRAFT_421830 [Rhypophila decipiens]|uniref:monoamine oxidase n=1 Tax=Rhypophila decipiens TaxID=261697 RepID=A0AAN6YCL4_9PEZI|nr:hypothetical protein QBC37DRAFT_421830 [Rhypophila decipiens]